MSSRLHLQNYFAVPNSLVDDAIIHQLSLAEVRTLLYILRHTYGFQKTQDAISQSQFLNGVAPLDSGTGLSRNSLRNALRCLEAKGCLRRMRQRSPSGRDLPTVYVPLLAPERGQRLDPSPAQGGHLLHGGGGNKPAPSEGAKFCTPQNTEIHLNTKGGSVLPPAASAPSRRGRTEPPSPGKVIGEAAEGLPYGRATHGLRRGDAPSSPVFGEAAVRLCSWFDVAHHPEHVEGPSRACRGTEGLPYGTSSEEEPKLPTFERESLKKRWERILAWYNNKWPLKECTPYERRLAYREMERLVRDPSFEPPPPGWRPPTFEEALEKMYG